MTAGARTFSIEDALLDPPALPPPPLRHALFVSLIALAALLHLTTLGWAISITTPRANMPARRAK